MVVRSKPCSQRARQKSRNDRQGSRNHQMKKAQLFLLAARATCVGAVWLRGEGIEEVSDHIEHFPLEDVNVDRRRLVEKEATKPTVGIFDEWPDQDIVGDIVEDEDEVYVEEWQGDDDDDDDEKDMMNDFIGEWTEENIAGNVVEIVEEDEVWSEKNADNEEDDLATNEYTPYPGSVALVGTDLMGEAVDQFNRRQTECGGDKSEFKVLLTTDLNGAQTRWRLIRLHVDGNKVIGQGPPSGTRYGDKSIYAQRWCLDPGQYKFRMFDTAGNGICSNDPANGCGAIRLFLNGQNAGRMINDKSDWKIKDFPIKIGFESRIDGADNNNSNSTSNSNNNSQWCQKVRSVMQVPRGTCRLPNGQRGHRVRVATKVDKFGNETSWTITRKAGNSNVVKMKMGPVIEANQQKAVEDCLPAGKYNLKFQDIDGVCCRHGQGHFKLIVNGKKLLDGGNFVKAIDHDFQLGFDWISSMSDRDCEWWWAHDHRRRDWHTRCYSGQYCNKTYRHLKWSPALKADAKVYADKLLDTCAVNGIEHDKTQQGENISKNRGGGRWGELYTADQVTKRFVDNEEFWGWSRNSHLTQAIWYPTQYMGCAESFKVMEGSNMKCRMQVCRYAKSGNCQMSTYNSAEGNNWMTPMMMDDSPCGPMCASTDGCYH